MPCPLVDVWDSRLAPTYSASERVREDKHLGGQASRLTLHHNILPKGGVGMAPDDVTIGGVGVAPDDATNSCVGAGMDILAKGE